jgi:hypothetical protein
MPEPGSSSYFPDAPDARIRLDRYFQTAYVESSRQIAALPDPEPIDPVALLDAIRRMTDEQRREMDRLLADAVANSFLIMPGQSATSNAPTLRSFLPRRKSSPLLCVV